MVCLPWQELLRFLFIGDAAGNLLAVLANTGRVQLWDLRQLRAELTKLHLDWETK